MKAFVCHAQGLEALADITTASDALGVVSDELVLGPSGLISTDERTQKEQAGDLLSCKANLKLAAKYTIESSAW